MEYIMMLTEQNKSPLTQCSQLVAANAELFQRSMALQQECYKLDVKNKELKASTYVSGFNNNRERSILLC